MESEENVRTKMGETEMQPEREKKGFSGARKKERARLAHEASPTKRGLGGGRRVIPQRDRSWCLTPLVLLMCDAQEIDRLCKTQPTGENNNNNTSQTHESGNSTGRCWEETAVGELDRQPWWLM